MKSPVLIVLVLVMALFACQGPEKQQQQTEGTDTTLKAYIPVTDYIRSEIRAVDSTAAGILRRVTYKDRSDSSFIKLEEFEEMARAFLPDELQDDDRFERSFKESSFMDQTTESVAFTYEAIDSTSTVRRVDVLISPSLGLDQIKSVYIEKSFAVGDTAVSQKMTWKSRKNFQIITLKSLPGGAADVHTVKVTWDPFSYQD